jgi:medium-chain acyl-[acyl-carrier-protein] hydrolase
MPWWYARNAMRTDALWRLFCFPYAGGSSAIFRDWRTMLAPSIEVVAVELPGHGIRRDERPFTELDPLVDALVPALLPDLNRPFAIFGHSLGALIGYELTRRLYTRVGLQPRRLFVSGHEAPGSMASPRHVHELPDEEFIAELHRLNGTPREILSDAQLMQLALPMLRADFQLGETYRYRPYPLLSCPISAYGGLSDQDVSAESITAWQRTTKGAFTSRMFDGDHFFIHTATSSLVRQIELDLTSSQPG